MQVFSLAEKFQHDEDHWCVCAACPHDLPQFKNNGVVCWLPEEGTIKIVGWDCFKARNPEAHRKAAALYNAQKQSRSDEAYLLSRLFYVPILLRDIESDIAIANAFEAARASFHHALIQQELQGLRRNIHYGRLRLDPRKGGTGHGKSEFATVTGAQFLDPTGGAFSTRLAKARVRLAELNFGAEWKTAVLAMEDKQKAKAVEVFGTAIAAWTRVQEELNRMRAFYSRDTGTIIEQWSMTPETTFPMFFEYTEEQIRIGHSALRNTVVVIPLEARAPLSVLPDMGPTPKN